MVTCDANWEDRAQSEALVLIEEVRMHAANMERVRMRAAVRDHGHKG